MKAAKSKTRDELLEELDNVSHSSKKYEITFANDNAMHGVKFKFKKNASDIDITLETTRGPLPYSRTSGKTSGVKQISNIESGVELTYHFSDRLHEYKLIFIALNSPSGDASFFYYVLGTGHKTNVKEEDQSNPLVDPMLKKIDRAFTHMPVHGGGRD